MSFSIGISSPRRARSGQPLPNPRVLSQTIHPQEDVGANFSHLLMQFGQFLDHDISLSPVTQLRVGGIQCCPRPTHPDCFEISVPRNDPFFSRMGKSCINFVRSVPCESCKTGARLQMNELTSFIDASNVYGNNINETSALRDKNGKISPNDCFNCDVNCLAMHCSSGLLAVGFDRNRRPILPESNSIENDQCSRPNRPCFRAGDNSRVNQHPSLTAMHTIWVSCAQRRTIAVRANRCSIV